MDDAALDALIDAGTTALGIEMKPEWRQAVRMHLAISLAHAATVLEASAARPSRSGAGVSRMTSAGHRNRRRRRCRATCVPPTS